MWFDSFLLSLSHTQKKAKGQVILERVGEYISLLEKDYFGLTFVDDDEIQVNWLSSRSHALVLKRIRYQIMNCDNHVMIKYNQIDNYKLSISLLCFYLTVMVGHGEENQQTNKKSVDIVDFLIPNDFEYERPLVRFRF